MFCPKCGAQNADTNKFCRKCGKQMPVRSGSGPLVSSDPFIGKVLEGKYRIEAKLGSGGMGSVYRATRVLIGDQVAFKLLHTDLARDPAAAARFRREAVLATKLQHPNVVSLLDVGLIAGYDIPYILMELAEGFTLRQIISENHILPLDFAVTVTTQVCSALERAHSLGIVHRDIKPENIIALQNANGWQIKVLDFGIAKRYNQTDIGLTQDGNSMGTPQYMSPEQCMGGEIDGRADVYSTGIVLYEMLSGSVPFKTGPHTAILVHQVHTAPQKPSAIYEDIHPEVEAVVMRSLEKSPPARHQSAMELARDLIRAATLAYRSGAMGGEAPIEEPEAEPEFAPVEEAVASEPKKKKKRKKDGGGEEKVDLAQISEDAESRLDEILSQEIKAVSPDGEEPKAERKPA